MLEIIGLKKYFPVRSGTWGRVTGQTRAVDGVDLCVHKGQDLGLVGESGSGKSTIARLVLNLIRPDSGKIIFEGWEVSSFNKKQWQSVRREIQMVFQDPYSSLDPRMSIRSVLGEPMRLAPEKFRSREEREERMVFLLRAVGLSEDALSRYPHEFSGGERQRIAIARALVVEPKLLILDEAVSSLDVLVQEQILGLLARLKKEFGLTYLFISHNLRVVRKVCEQVAVMYSGKIVEAGSTQDILDRPFHPYTRNLMKAAMDYQVADGKNEILIDPAAQMCEKEQGHFVLE